MALPVGPDLERAARKTLLGGGILMALLSIREWARRCHKSRDRALNRVKLGDVPAAIPLHTGPKQVTFAIPEGTPWPSTDKRPDPPPGMVSIRTWAESHGRHHDTARSHIIRREIPEGMEKIRGFWFVPAGMPWPWKLGRPRNQRAA